MSVYKRDSVVPKLMEHLWSEERKINFLKNRIYIYLRGNKDQAYSHGQICHAFDLSKSGPNGDEYLLAYKAIDLLLQEKDKLHIKLTQDRNKLYYTTETENV